MEIYFGVAEEMDITEEELAAIRAMVMAVSAEKIFFQSKIVLEKMAAQGAGDAESGCHPGCCE